MEGSKNDGYALRTSRRVLLGRDLRSKLSGVYGASQMGARLDGACDGSRTPKIGVLLRRDRGPIGDDQTGPAPAATTKLRYMSDVTKRTSVS
nr:hypothetical protein CFP56_02626 [Quercus suber]